MLNFNQKKLESQLPSFFQDLLRELLDQGFQVTLVGGAVRDFILAENLGTDWDIELSHHTISFNLHQWKGLGKSLARFGRMTFLPYDVIRLELNGHTLEFSPPRIEHFEEHLKEKGHKNFSVTFDFKLPFVDAVKRRDFTVNSMGLRFNSQKDVEFMDPLDGLRHLREGTLMACGADFAKDPVRFLRALRFMRKFNLQPSPDLMLELKQMKVSGFSASYLWSEMQKSADPLNYYLDLLNWLEVHPELALPVREELAFKSEELKKILKHPAHHEAWMIALSWVGINPESWQLYFAQSSESARRLSRWASETHFFQTILPETFHGEFDSIKEKPEFQKLFDWYFSTKQILQKYPQLPLLSMIENYLPDWIHLYRFEPVKDVKHIDPPLRAKYQVWNLCQRL